MARLKAVVKEVRHGGASLYITISFEKAHGKEEPEVLLKKEYRISKEYSQEKIFGIIKKDLNLFRKHDQMKSKISKLIDKDILDM